MRYYFKDDKGNTFNFKSDVRENIVEDTEGMIEEELDQQDFYKTLTLITEDEYNKLRNKYRRPLWN